MSHVTKPIGQKTKSQALLREIGDGSGEADAKGGRNMEDPFHQVRKQVVSMLATCERQQTKWGEARRRKPVRHDE